MLEELDKKIIAALQEDLPLEPRPYLLLAERLGVTEAEILSRLQRYRETGIIRKMGAVLRHREVGFVANALCAWQVPDDQVEKAGGLLASFPFVTHCYSRKPYPDWPYNLYVMLHAQSRSECRQYAAELAGRIGSVKYVMLFSTREWKKSTVRYFREAGDGDKKF